MPPHRRRLHLDPDPTDRYRPGRSGRKPPGLDYGTIPVNTTKTLSLTITVDAGCTVGVRRRHQRPQPAVRLPVRHLQRRPRWLPRPRHLHDRRDVHAHEHDPAAGEVDVFECPLTAGACISIPMRSLRRPGVVEAAANPASLDYGTVPVNTTKTLSSTITVDAGDTVESAGGISGLNPPFGFQFGACGSRWLPRPRHLHDQRDVQSPRTRPPPRVRSTSSNAPSPPAPASRSRSN